MLKLIVIDGKSGLIQLSAKEEGLHSIFHFRDEQIRSHTAPEEHQLLQSARSDEQYEWLDDRGHRKTDMLRHAECHF